MNKREAKKLKRLKQWKKTTSEEPVPTQETMYSYANYKAYEKRVQEHLKDLEPPYTLPVKTPEGRKEAYQTDSVEELARFSWNILKQVNIDPMETELTYEMQEYLTEEE